MRTIGIKIGVGLIIVVSVVIVGIYSFDYPTSPSEQTSVQPSLPSATPNALSGSIWGHNDNQLVGTATDIFVGKVLEKTQDDTFNIQVIYTIKGNARGVIPVSQRRQAANPGRGVGRRADITEDYSIRPGSTYLLIIQYIKQDEEIHNLHYSPQVKKLISDNKDLSFAQLEELARKDTRVYELLSAYVNEEVRYPRNNDNRFSTLTPAEQQIVLDKFKNLIPPRPVPAIIPKAPPPPPTENNLVACRDRSDNDGDNLADAQDPDCKPWLNENNYALCHDNIDDDMDGLKDSADPDCAPFLPPPPPVITPPRPQTPPVAPPASSTPATPGVPTLSAIGTSTVHITWDAVPGATSYKLERAPGNTPGTFTEIANTSDRSFTDRSLAPVTTYYYRLRAWRDGVHGSYSQQAMVRTLGE